ncbi:hypothetical protein WJX79_002891 [Trebouxia sp. C0005]|nr:MAG: hypothetical protein FRX49_07574 [Trebouxia sp. A1-2]
MESKLQNYTRATLMESQGDYDSEDDDAYISLHPKAEVYTTDGEWYATAGGGRTAPMQRAPEKRAAFSDEHMKAVREGREAYGECGDSGAIGSVLAQHKQDPQDVQRLERLPLEHGAYW